MPEFRQAQEVGVEAQGRGWSVATLADRRHVPGMPMAARRWQLAGGASAPEQEHNGGSERFLYVIAGSGRVKVGEATFALEREDVLWLEPGDRYALEAGAAGLEILDALSDS